MSLNRTRPNEVRAPDFIELPDGRKRLVRYFEIANGTNITDGLVEAYGTADVGPATGTTAGFASLRLVDQRLTKIGDASVYQKTYEELPATAELQVGGATTGNTKIQLEDGRVAIEAEFLQLVAGTYSPGTVGTTTAPGDTSAFLQTEEMSCDGMIRKIKRRYVYAGQISETNETRNNGALLLRTLVYVKTAPSTPSGYTVISQQQTPVNGLPVYTYTYAKGNGQISQDDQTENNGALLRRTIRHLVAPSASNPISTPAGYTLVSEAYQEADGHRIWTAAYAKGNGQISQDDQTDNNGSLLRRTIRHLVAPSAANPISTPSGYTLISEAYLDSEGHRIWTAAYAKGNGQISQDDQTSNGGALLRRTIRHLVAPSASNPISTPAGYTLISESYQEADGHRIWTATYAKGDGEISREIDYSQSSDQGTTGITRTTIRYLVSGGSTVQPTSLAGSVEVGRSSTDADGHRIWTTVWAKGTGTISTETTNDEGSVVITTTTQIVNAGGGTPSVPSNSLSRQVRNESGYKIYVDRYISSGSGTTRTSTTTRSDGSTEYVLVAVGASASTPGDPTGGSAYLVSQNDHQSPGGYWTSQVTYIKPPPGTTFYKSINVSLPGQASFSGATLIMDPPITKTLLANVAVSYSTSQNSTTPMTVTTYATYSAAWTPSDTGISVSQQQGMGGYVGSSSVSGSSGTFNGVTCTTYAASVSGSSPTSRPSGSQTISVDNEIYLVSLSGTVVYRSTVVTASV